MKTASLERFVGGVVRRRGRVLAVHALVALAALAGLPRLSSDNTPRAFLPEGDPAVVRHREFTERFGNDEALRLVVDVSGRAPTEAARVLDELAQRAAEIPHARAVESPVREGGGLRPELVGADGSLASVLVRLEALDPAATAEVVEAARAVVADLPPDLDAFVSGPPVLNAALDESSREIGTRFFPLILVVAVGLLAFVFRSAGHVLVPLVFVGIVEGMAVGLMGWSGVRLNLVLAILPPLLFVVTLATSVHLLVRLRHLAVGGLSGDDAVLATWKDKSWAVFWTGATTSAGFLSLASSPIPPVRSLGLWAAAGIALGTVLAFTLLPALASFLTVGEGAATAASGGLEALLRRFGRRCATLALTHRHAITLVFLLLAVAAALGLGRLGVQSHALRYLPPDHPVRVGVERLERAELAVSAFDVVLESRAGGLRDPEGLLRLAAVQESLDAMAGTFGAAGVGDVVAEAERRGRAMGVVVPRPALASALAQRSDAQGALDEFVTRDGRWAHVTVLVPMEGYRELDPVVAAAVERVREAFPEASVSATGQLLLLNDVQRRLIRTLVVSLSLSLVAVGVVFWILLGSLELAGLALVPNLWPIVLTVGGMGWLGVPLDVATVMVASVVLGLAVDDTIHTLAHFRQLAGTSERSHALAVTLERTAPAYVLTAAILGVGFGTCALSSFVPTSRFGELSAVAIGLAVLGDLLLVPALLGHASHGAARRLGRR